MTIVDDQHIVSPNCSTGSDHAVLSNETMVRKSDITVEPLCDFELEKYSVRVGFEEMFVNICMNIFYFIKIYLNFKFWK